jgi:hypothetical protein
MAYFSYFHSVMTYGIIFWGIPVIAVSFSDSKKESLVLSQGLGTGTPAENILGHSKYYHCSHSTHCPFFYL